MTGRAADIFMQCLALGVIIVAGAITSSCGAKRAEAPAPTPAVMTGQQGITLYDFEQHPRRFNLTAEESVTPASGTGRIDQEHVHEGRASYRIDFDYPRSSAALHLNHVALNTGDLPGNLWGIEAWARQSGGEPLHVEFLIEEEGGELWTAGAAVRMDGRGKSWHRIIIPFDWASMLSWTRDNGRLDADQIKTVRLFVKKSDHQRSAKGTLWLDSIRMINGIIPVTAKSDGDFQLLDLTPAFDSDSFATKANPADGDFHTGDWEPRTIPAEQMPQISPYKFKGIPFNLPPMDDGRDNTIRSNGQILTGFPAERYTAIYVLCTGKFGDHAGDITLHYAGGESQKLAFQVSDTGRRARFGETAALRLKHVYHEDQIDERKPEIYIQSIRVDSSRVLESIALPHHDFIKIFAITLSTSASPPPVGAMAGKPLGQIDPRYDMPADLNLDFTQPVRSAGALGGYLFRHPNAYRLMIPGFNGFMACAFNGEDFPNNLLVWDKFLNRQPPFSFGGLRVEGYMSSLLDVQLPDSTCLIQSAEITDRDGRKFNYKVTASRAWPAVLFETTSPEFHWFDPDEGGQTWITMPRDNGYESSPVRHGTSLPLPSEPWMLVWHTGGDDGRRAFDVPVLIVLEKRPQQIRMKKHTKDGGLGIHFYHDNAAGRVAVMPLFGIRRLDLGETQKWAAESVGESVLAQAQLWARRLQNFPIALHQDFTMDDAAGRLAITDRFDWIAMSSDWEFEPQRFTPLPPVAILAMQNDYPVVIDTAATDAELPVFAGPLWGVGADESRYSIPLADYTERVLVPSRLEQHPLSDTLHKDFAQQIDELLPRRIMPRHLRSDTAHDLAIQRILGPARLLMQDDGAAAREYGRAVIENALSDANLKLEFEPLTHQYYLMDNRFWARDRDYDKEWAIGFMLQGVWNHAWYQNDFEIVREHWNKIRGLYRYYQIIFDWANSTTWTMATGAGANSDGMRIAWEGMISMARLARAAGDEATHDDARIRASRQMMSLYASWFASQWSVENDYVTRGNRYIPTDQAETRFSPDVLWTESFISNTSGRWDFFQVTHAFYIFNLSQVLFLHDFRLDVTKARPWLMDIVPELHPNWADGNARMGSTGQFYGNNGTMAHLVMRSILLHQDPAEVYEFYLSSTKDTESIKQWYTPMGQAPYAIAAMQSAPGPGVIVPVDGWFINENVFRFDDQHQRVTVTSTKPAQGRMRFWCWNNQPVKIQVNGHDTEWEWDDEANYSTVTMNATEPGAKFEIDVWLK